MPAGFGTWKEKVWGRRYVVVPDRIKKQILESAKDKPWIWDTPEQIRESIRAAEERFFKNQAFS